MQQRYAAAEITTTIPCSAGGRTAQVALVVAATPHPSPPRTPLCHCAPPHPPFPRLPPSTARSYGRRRRWCSGCCSEIVLTAGCGGRGPEYVAWAAGGAYPALSPPLGPAGGHSGSSTPQGGRDRGERTGGSHGGPGSTGGAQWWPTPRQQQGRGGADGERPPAPKRIVTHLLGAHTSTHSRARSGDHAQQQRLARIKHV